MSPNRLTMPRNTINRIADRRGSVSFATLVRVAVAVLSGMGAGAFLPIARYRDRPPGGLPGASSASRNDRSHQPFGGCGEPISGRVSEARVSSLTDQTESPFIGHDRG